MEGSKRGRGRPAGFDRAAALREAMKLFWERGYEGTSFDDLIAAMGISASSFYNAFGNKEQVYQQATDAYLEASAYWFVGILDDDKLDTQSAFRRLLEAAAREFTRDDLPAGCMISLAGTHVPPGLATMRDMMVRHRAVSEEAFAARIRKGIAAGDVLVDADVEILAAYFSAIARGLAVQARDGASRERLMEIAEVAMRVWPAVHPAKRQTKKSKRQSRGSVIAK
jgi:AcrR family transcriptional regulator